jgi:hypothetical protein
MSVVWLLGGTGKGVDDASCDSAFPGISENGVACRGDDAEFYNGTMVTSFLVVKG